MNANAYGGDLSRVLEWVEVATAGGTERRDARRARLRLPALEPRRRARSSPRASFALEPAEPDAVKATLADMRASAARPPSPRASRPSAPPSRTPTTLAPRAAPPASCSRRRAAAASQVGGARFSEKHANFVENTGEATTADVVALMAEGRRRVRERFGVELEPEVQLLGDVDAAELSARERAARVGQAGRACRARVAPAARRRSPAPVRRRIGCRCCGGRSCWRRLHALAARLRRWWPCEKVHGDGRSPGDDAPRIRAALSGAARDMTTLHVDRERLERGRGPYPVVSALRGRARLPARPADHVIEHRPVGRARGGGQRVPVAADGALLPGPAHRRPLPAPGGGACRRPAARAAGRADAVARWRAAAPAAAGGAAVRSSASGERGMVVELREGPELIFGSPDRLDAKWAAAARVLADPRPGAAYVDVRLPERPAAGGLVETVPGAAASPPAAPSRRGGPGRTAPARPEPEPAPRRAARGPRSRRLSARRALTRRSWRNPQP